MKKKPIILFIIILFLLFIIGNSLGSKIYKVRHYDINKINNYENYIDGLVIKDTITIDSKELSEDEYLVFNDIKIRNDFNNFTKLLETNNTSEYTKYVLYDENQNMVSSFWMNSSEQYIDIFKNDVFIFNNQGIEYENVNLKEYFDKENITNDVDLFKYLVKTKDKKNNIFTSINDMRGNYAIHSLISIVYPNIDSINLIDGDYQGYVLKINNAIEINIIKNNKRYIFTLIDSNYFNDEYIKDLLNTIVIK